MHTHKHKQTEPHHDKVELYLRPLITLTNPSIKYVAFVGGRGAAKPWGEWDEDALEFSRAFVLASRVKTARMAALPRKLSHARKHILPTKRALKNAAEIQFGTKFLFGLLIEIIIRCDFSSRGVLG